jgi:hypothetical protein
MKTLAQYLAEHISLIYHYELQGKDLEELERVIEKGILEFETGILSKKKDEENNTPVLDMEQIILFLQISDKQIAKYGGKKNYEDLLYDIIDRYGNESYFDPDLIEQIQLESEVQ